MGREPLRKALEIQGAQSGMELSGQSDTSADRKSIAAKRFDGAR
jgi:hypothetical protein